MLLLILLFPLLAVVDGISLPLVYCPPQTCVIPMWTRPMHEHILAYHIATVPSIYTTLCIYIPPHLPFLPPSLLPNHLSKR